MSQFFPHAAYAEDQPLSKTILTAHVIYRGFQTGATIGIVVGGLRSLRRSPTGATAQSLVIRSTGVGGVVGAASVALLLPVYMRGKEDIEWSDRSWRLLANKGQVEVDNWSLVGTAAGLATLVLPSARVTSGSSLWKVAAGRAGVGNMVGVAGYMVWRHGIHRGVWD